MSERTTTPDSPEDLAHLETLLATIGVDSETVVADVPATIAPLQPRLQTQDRAALDALPRFATDGAAGGNEELQLGPTIGQGGMGIIRRAVQVPLGRDVAVKSVRPERIAPETTLALLREAWVTGGLEHPNVVPVHALGQTGDGSPLLVMKRIEGVAWLDILRGKGQDPRHSATADPLGRDLEILLAVCNAVGFAHSRGIAHRDLKPENIMVGTFGEVYVLDWGLAVSVLADGDFRVPRAADIRGIAGTPSYMAPEMVNTAGWAHIGLPTDVFLLGAILHEVLVGKARHAGRTVLEVLSAARCVEPFEYPADVPAELAAIANKATARDPADRYADAQTFRAALSTFVRHRHSLNIADTACDRLADLKKLAIDPQTWAQSGARVPGLLAECRFGFRMALREWSNNEAAREGLQDTLTTVADMELQLGRLQTASSVIAELTDPPAALLERLSALEAEVAAEQQKVAALREMERELDIQTGTRTRAFLTLVIALIYGALPAIAGYAISRGWMTWGHEHNIFLAADFTGLIASLGWWARDTLDSTEVNRRIARGLGGVAGADILLTAYGYWMDAPPTLVLSMAMVLFFNYWAMMAANIDKRLYVAALIYVVALVVCAAWPAHLFYWLAAGNFTSCMYVAWVWRPGNDYVRADERDPEKTAS